MWQNIVMATVVAAAALAALWRLLPTRWRARVVQRHPALAFLGGGQGGCGGCNGCSEGQSGCATERKP